VHPRQHSLVFGGRYVISTIDGRARFYYHGEFVKSRHIDADLVDPVRAR